MNRPELRYQAEGLWKLWPILMPAAILGTMWLLHAF